MNERLRQLRKVLALSQDEFGNRLGVTGPGISKIESGHRNLTEQMIKAICREFNVDYMWLTTGEGEMLSVASDDDMELIDRIMFGENNFAKQVFKAFAKLDENDWKMLEKVIDKVSAMKDEEFEQTKKAD